MNGSLNDQMNEIRQEMRYAHFPPSGTLTYLFTDIEGSTQLWDQYPEQARAAMKRHDELIEAAVEQQAGFVVRPRGEGDSRFAVFQRASDALRAAVNIQHLLFSEPWSIQPLRARIALHSGESDFRDGDYYGNTVNRCARLRSAAHGGQILLSETTHFLVRDELPAGVSIRDLGAYNLKGLERPENIFQLVVEGLPHHFPPLNTPDQIHNNLPLPLTRFIGRKQALDELEHLLWQSRLLTIAGPGGAGKTRLAVQLAQNVQGSFQDGVWFVDLAPLASTTLISQYIMNILGIREEAGFSPAQTLMDSLRGKELLLIIDNCEHLLPEISILAESMLRCTIGLRVIATSREKLGIDGELLWRVSSLSTPRLELAVPFDHLLRYESIQLFQDRAVSVRPDFAITRENANAVVKICARLDGIPLAIELAAARVRVLSVEEIAARLDDRFHLLVGSPASLPRQQTLRALIDWSHELLTQKERMLLRRLSVFTGGWTLDAAEQVCSDGNIEAGEVLDLLTSLIDKSFVICEVQNGHQRYHFLETIQKFSQERLAESQEADEYAQKHAEYFLKVAETAYGKLWAHEQGAWLVVLDEEYDNLRSTLGWLSDRAGQEALILRCVSYLWRYWEIRGYITEGRSWLEAALAKKPDAMDELRANALSAAGFLARHQADYWTAKILHQQSLDIFRAVGNKPGIARQLNALGEIAQNQGEYTLAVEFLVESLTLWHEIGDREGTAVALRQLGGIARDHGQYQSAGELLEESLKLERRQGNKLFIALSLNDLGLVAYHLCHYARAVSLFEEALRYQRELNDRIGISNSLQNLGNAAKDQGDFKQAERLYKESLTLKQSLGEKRGIAQAVVALAEIAVLQGNYAQAENLARRSLALSNQLGIKRVTLHSLVVLGFNTFYQGNYQMAATFAEKSLKLSMELDAPQAAGYAKALLALILYAEGSLVAAKEKLHEALTIFQKINDYRNIAHTDVNLARTAYRQGDHQLAMHFLEESLSISRKLNARWTLGFVLEIMGLLQRQAGNYNHALMLFQESLRISVEQNNRQGIANCLGALAGLAVLADQPVRAARLFAAAEKLRQTMGAKMSSNDRLEYEKYLSMAREQMDHTSFEAEWSAGLQMTSDDVIEDLTANNLVVNSNHHEDLGHQSRAYAAPAVPLSPPETP